MIERERGRKRKRERGRERKSGERKSAEVYFEASRSIAVLKVDHDVCVYVDFDKHIKHTHVYMLPRHTHTYRSLYLKA